MSTSHTNYSHWCFVKEYVASAVRWRVAGVMRLQASRTANFYGFQLVLLQVYTAVYGFLHTVLAR